MKQPGQVVVVGGSVAAATTASSLRAEGFEGDIVLLSGEETAPYSRVPLSKGVLAGTEHPDETALPALPEGVEVRLGTRVEQLDLAGRHVTTEHGERVAYDGLVLATGARARRLAAVGQSGERVLRDLSDATDLAKAAATARTAVVVGAGFLGMEIASTLSGLGVQVTVVDREPGLDRVLGPWLGHRVRAHALARGVRLLVAEHGVSLLGDPVAAVDAGEHGILEADLVITAAGDVPNIEWLAGSGVPLHAGVVIDSACRVADRVVAAGDVACVRRGSGAVRLPHWTSAVNQGRQAARTMVGRAENVPDDPYFWTAQFGLDIKLSGIPGAGEPALVDGDLDAEELLLQWEHPDGSRSAASVNFRIPVVKLKRLGAAAALAGPSPR